MVNPAPDNVAELTVIAAVPDEVSVRVLDKVELTSTFPNASELALTANCDETPVPVRETVDVLPLAEVLETVIVPVAEPAAVGAKLTCRLTVWPGFNVTGKVAPDILKPVPERVA